MKRTIEFVRKYRFSILCLAIVWYLSIWFLPPKVPQLENVAFIDKWTHFVMYGGTCSVIWWEYWRSHTTPQWGRLLLLAWCCPIVMSGIIELVQEYCTLYRSGEWLDLAANATGCSLGAMIGLLMKRF
jgi:VanZ family protein